MSWSADDAGSRTRQFHSLMLATQRSVTPEVQRAQLAQPRLTAKGMSRPIFAKE
jgi:hypothetical protein